MKEKYCTGCSQYRNIENMEKFKRRNNIYRWICKSCLERRSESIYKSKDKSNGGLRFAPDQD